MAISLDVVYLHLRLCAEPMHLSALHAYVENIVAWVQYEEGQTAGAFRTPKNKPPCIQTSPFAFGMWHVTTPDDRSIQYISSLWQNLNFSTPAVASPTSHWFLVGRPLIIDSLDDRTNTLAEDGPPADAMVGLVTSMRLAASPRDTGVLHAFGTARTTFAAVLVFSFNRGNMFTISLVGNGIGSCVSGEPQCRASRQLM